MGSPRPALAGLAVPAPGSHPDGAVLLAALPGQLVGTILREASGATGCLHLSLHGQTWELDNSSCLPYSQLSSDIHLLAAASMRFSPSAEHSAPLGGVHVCTVHMFSLLTSGKRHA